MNSSKIMHVAEAVAAALERVVKFTRGRHLGPGQDQSNRGGGKLMELLAYAGVPTVRIVDAVDAAIVAVTGGIHLDHNVAALVLPGFVEIDIV